VQERSLTCEARAACDLLEYYGVETTEEAFQAGLPRSDNPDLGFVGEPDAPGGRLPPEGYGVHAWPVASRMREFEVDARARCGGDAAWLRDRLAEGSPVIVWVTTDLAPRCAVERRDRFGRIYRCVPWEHVLLVTGHDACAITAIDPGDGRERRIPWPRFLASWECLGRMAVWVAPGPPPRSGR
jgi:uncharacterized protein YvpB